MEKNCSLTQAQGEVTCSLLEENVLIGLALDPLVFDCWMNPRD